MPNLPVKLPVQYERYDGKLISELPDTKEFWTDERILKMTTGQLLAVKRHVNLAMVPNEQKVEHLIRHIQQWRSGKRSKCLFCKPFLS